MPRWRQVVRPQRRRVGQQPEEILGGLLGRGHQGHPFTHDIGDDAGEQRIVRAPQDEGVDLSALQGREVVTRHLEQLRSGGDPTLDELHEARAGHRQQLHLRGRREGIGIRPRRVGADRADDPDSRIAGGSHRTAHRGSDDLDDRHVISLARIVQHRGAGGVAGDDERLDPTVDEPVETLQGKLPSLGNRPGAVRSSGRVTEVDDALVRELVEHGASDGEAPVSGVENPDRCVGHQVRIKSPTPMARTRPRSGPSHGIPRRMPSHRQLPGVGHPKRRRPMRAPANESCNQVRKS